MSTQSLQKRGQKQLVEERHVWSTQTHIFRKELNLYGKLAIGGVWTVVIFLLGIMWGDKENRLESEILLLKAANQEMIETLKSTPRSVDEFQLRQANKVLGKQIEERLMLAIEGKELNSQRVIARQKERIQDLEGSLQRLMQIKQDRDPGSIEPYQVPYSSTNLTLLRVEQRQRVKELKRKQEEERNIFLAINDVTKREARVRWEQMKSLHEMALIRLEEKFQQERSDFRKNKFRIVRR